MTRLLAGKLPNDLLSALLARVAPGDPRVIVGPGVGRDAAVIDTGGPQLLVAKADPITFASDLVGWYAVHVNANDIACTGGAPAWFLATVLLPEGCEDSLPGQIFGQVAEACRELGVALVGGHTEVTIGLDRPVVAGAMLGEVSRGRLVEPQSARPGDAVILTRGVAVEGTAVLAREAGPALLARGVPQSVIGRAADYLRHPGISVVAAARALCDNVAVRALHDPTEGGVATALYELAAACNAGLRIDGEIRVLPETRAICDAAGLDPLGLLASGSLLAVVPEEETDAAVAALQEASVPAFRIGQIVDASKGVIMTVNGTDARLKPFARDEIARYFSGRTG